ncbi:hypothetical protein ES702_07201 [subsurface metagenome]
MPIKSIRRKNRDNTDLLLQGYKNFLKAGIYLDDDDHLEGPEHEFRIWKRYRETIMAEYSPGGLEYSTLSPGLRPHGYWLFELKETPPANYYQQTKRLLKLGKLTSKELDTLRRDPFLSARIAGKSKELRKLLSMKNVLNLDQKRRDKSEKEEDEWDG